MQSSKKIGAIIKLIIVGLARLMVGFFFIAKYAFAKNDIGFSICYTPF
jgi:hypothetical protein